MLLNIAAAGIVHGTATASGYGAVVVRSPLWKIAVAVAARWPSPIFGLCSLQGLILATRFRVYVLIPFICIAVAIVGAVWNLTESHDYWLLIGQELTAAVALQLGYFVGAILWFAVIAKWKQKYPGLSNAELY